MLRETCAEKLGLLRRSLEQKRKKCHLRQKRCKKETGVCPLLNFRCDPFQDLDKSLALAFSNDVIKIALVPACAARQHGEDFLSGRREMQSIGSAVAVHASSLDQATASQILHHRRHARLVAPIGLRQLGLADARIPRDQSQSRETPWALANVLRAPRERLKCSFLRHTQIKPDPGSERPEVDRPGKFAVPDASSTT